MKKIIVVLSITCSLFICACGNSTDTTTNMPDSGYEPRSDSSSMPATTSGSPSGAVAVDSVKNGQFNVSGVPDSAIKRKDSADKK